MTGNDMHAAELDGEAHLKNVAFGSILKTSRMASRMLPQMLRASHLDLLRLSPCSMFRTRYGMRCSALREYRSI